MSSGEESNREEELAVVNLENVKRISETYQPRKGKGKTKKGTIPKSVVQEIWKDRLSPRFYSRLMSVMFPEDSNEVSFLSFYTIYKNLAEPETEIMFRALTIYHIATIHEPPFNYETANEYPNASHKAIKDYVCDVITSYLHAIININMKEALAWLSMKASNTLIDGNLVASYILKDLETHRNEVSIGSLEIWLEKNEIYYTVSEQLYLFLFGVNSSMNVKPLIPYPVVQTSKVNKTLLALPDVLLLNSKLRKRAQRWTLAYILDRHSQNWETLKQAIYGKDKTIIVIQDANGDIFGMYGSQRWVPTEGFFGNDECFLFTLKPDVNIYEGSGRDNNFQLFNESGIGMGGTEDKPGLIMLSDPGKGKTSLACRTFREFWPLARELEFKISQIEIWTVNEDEAFVEEDVRDLICNTQYMKMRGDEVFNETVRAFSPCLERPVEQEKTRVRYSPEGQRPAKCWGECAMYSTCDPQAPKYNRQRVCCSKKCTKKIKVPYRDQNGEGDGNISYYSLHKVPGQEEEKLQQSHKRTVQEVDMNRDVYRRRRTSADARQKHGAAGFIHPSLAAAENERNAREAAELAKKKAKDELGDAETVSEAREQSTTKQSNKTRASRIRKLSKDPEQSIRSSSPGDSSNQVTYNDNQTQVGESRLMKNTCRSYKHSNKCSCVPTSTCACSPKDVSPISTNDNTYMITSTNKTLNEKTKKSKKSNGKRPSPKAQNNQNTTQEREDDSKSQKSATTVDFTVSSSSSAMIETRKSDSNEPSNLDTNGKTSPIKSKPGIKVAAAKIKTTSPTVKSEASGTYTKAELNQSVKETLNSPQSFRKGILNLNTPLNQVEESTTQDQLVQDSMLQLQLDCRCSSESVCEVPEATKKSPATTCCCENKLSSYMTRTNKTAITDVSLSEVSSSVCSCILDNKKNTTGLTNSSMRETQKLCKSRRKSIGSMDSGQSKNTDRGVKSCVTNSRASKMRSLPKRETQVHVKSKRTSKTSADFVSGDEIQPVPPTCLKCRALVGHEGCQCKSQSNKKKLTAKDTQRLTHAGRTSEFSTVSGSIKVPSKSGSTRSIKDSDRGGADRLMATDSGLTSPSLTRLSSQSFLSKQQPNRSCKKSCKCSLSPSYFPVFPEDLIKEDTEDCDCASYNNLRFPVIVETPPSMSREPSRSEQKSLTVEPEPEQVEEPPVEEPKLKKCGCDDSDNTIIILNVSKCDTAGTVEKIIHEMEEKSEEPKIKSLLFKCKDLTEHKSSPNESKIGVNREVLRQQIDKILNKKRQPAPEQENPAE